MGSGLHVIKIGGNVIDDDTQLQSFVEKFAAPQGKKILVHGGGKIATRIAADLGIEEKLINGRRITDKPMLDVATMEYAGLTNKDVDYCLEDVVRAALG